MGKYRNRSNELEAHIWRIGKNRFKERTGEDRLSDDLLQKEVKGMTKKRKPPNKQFVGSRRQKSHSKSTELTRQEALDMWLATHDPSEYRFDTPQDHATEPVYDLPEGYKPSWRIAGVDVAVPDDPYGERPRRKDPRTVAREKRREEEDAKRLRELMNSEEPEESGDGIV